MNAETRRRTLDQAWASASGWGRKPINYSQPGQVARIYICVCGTKAAVSNGAPPTGWIEDRGRWYCCPECLYGRAA